MATTQDLITELYVGYFGRAPDPDGLNYWVGRYTATDGTAMTLAEIAQSFSVQPETTSTYAYLDFANKYPNLPNPTNPDDFITEIYQNLFNRDPDAVGLAYWHDQLVNQGKLPGQMIVDIISGAQGDDAVIVANKVAVGIYYANQVGALGADWNADTDPGDVSDAHTVLSGVTVDPATVDAGKVTADKLINADINGDGTLFDLTHETAAGADVMRITGNQDVRIDLTNPNSQITGLDLNGDGVIENNGKENNSPIQASGYEIVDAYARDPLNEGDIINNFTGDIEFDGTGFGGDGVSTDGNIYLGGLGVDKAFGGIGNDFLTGGGVAEARFQVEIIQGVSHLIDTQTGKDAGQTFDYLQGGRNADFGFVELSALDNTDGQGLRYDGGETADNINGTSNVNVDPLGDTNDRDWVLLEASDDDEPTRVTLADSTIPATAGPGDVGPGIVTRSGNAAAWLAGVEAVDASGNLYGMVNDMDVQIGGRARDARSADAVPGTENYGIGSTSQLVVNGSDSANIVVAGYDNDTVNGANGNDVLFGGNLDFLLHNRNNPNLLDSKGGLDLNVNAAKTVSDGRDILNGDGDNDALVFESASGAVNGGGGFDTLYVTNESVGRVQGTVFDASYNDQTAQADALKALSTDQVIRIDLGNANGQQFHDYGGANRGLGVAPVEPATGDQTNYVGALGNKAGSTVTTVEGFITTGLGDIDYKAAGSNSPELTFNNQQNYQGSVARFDARGADADEQAVTNPITGITYTGSTTKFGNYWTDANFGQDGSNGVLDNADVGQGSTQVAYREVGDNLIYLSGANDTLEGRGGDDELGGGKGDDNFIFNFGDGTDIVRRQADANGDNLWDTDAAGNRLYSQDFRADPSGIAASRLQIDFNGTDLTSPNVAVGDIRLVINPGQADAEKLATGDLSTYHSITEIADAANAKFHAIDPSISVVASGNSLIVTDTKGRDISDTVPEGYAVFVTIGNSSASTTATLNPGGQVLQENDRVIFQDYLDRNANSLVNNATDELRNQAQDLVIGTGSTTTLANGQEWRIQLQNLAVGDKVDVEINGTHFVRTVQTGENTDAFVANFVNQINTSTLDIYTGAGQVAAAFADVNAGNVNERVLVLNQAAIGNGENKVYMSAPNVAITAVNGSASSASWALANTSATSIELYNFDGRDGNLNKDDVLFIGRSGQSTLTTADSTAILQFAKNAGETLAGKDASVVLIPRDSAGNITIGGQMGNNDGTVPLANRLYHAINGDDQLIGGNGNDTLNGGTGDDRFVGSKGTDTIDGGGNVVAPNGEKINFVDSILFQENDFVPKDSLGNGTKFTVTLDASLDSVGKGVVTAVDSKGGALGTTSFTNIEEIRTASNTAQDTIDFSGLSNSVATATGASANQDQTPLVVPAVVGKNYNEGVRLNLTAANAGLSWAADRDNNDNTTATNEVGVNPVAVFGVENVIGGAANDIVVMDKTQAGSSNNISLAGEQPDLTPGPTTFTEGRDLVSYDHASLLDEIGIANGRWELGEIDNRPTLTVVAESGSNTDTVSATGGAVGTAVVTDTLIGVEVLEVTAAATNKSAADVLDLSKIAGATVNFGAADVTVGLSLGGQNKADSVANVEANTLERGGISVSAGPKLGDELLEINGITQLERLNGSTGDDRVIIGNGAGFTNANFALPNTPFFQQAIGFNFFSLYDNATRTYDTTDLVNNRFLYQYDLGSGSSDAIDFRGTTNGVAVVLDFTKDGSEGDYLVVDGSNGGVFNDGGTFDRIDLAKNVERYYARQNLGASQVSAIDLSRATEAVTVTFGAESKELGNEVKDPNGIDPNAGATKTPDNQITGINVSTATNASVAHFMESSANPATGSGNAFWNTVEGSNQNETVKLSQYQDRLANETFNLRGGNNTVDYTNAVKVGQNDSYTLSVSDFTPTLNTTTTHGGYAVQHDSIDGPATGLDAISITRQLDAKNVNTDGALTVIGSSNGNDTVSIATLAQPQGLNNTAPFVLNPPLVTGNDLTGANKAGVAVSEEANLLDITGTLKGGYNLVDLGSGLGVTTGSVVQDANLNFKGQNAIDDNVLTSISNFENILGSGFNDRLYGNDSNNVITGNGGSDVYVGRGGGDTLNLFPGITSNDRVVYQGAGDTADVLGGDNKAHSGEFDIINNFDKGLDSLVLDFTVAGGFNPINFQAQVHNFGAAAANPANGAIILQEANAQKLAADADLLDMTLVAAKLSFGGTTFTTAVNNNSQAIFVVEGQTQAGVYVWNQLDNGSAGEVASATVDPGELRLLTVLNGQAVDAAETPANFTLDDVAIRQAATATGVADTVLFTNGVRNEIVYTALNQSTYGQIDTIGKFTAGVLTNGFENGIDRIDLSGLNLGAQDGLALNAIVTRDRTGAGSQITDANANDFFYGADNVHRAVVVEYDNDDIDGATAGVQARARVFVDLNGDGQLNTTQDMFIDLATQGTSTNPVGLSGTGFGNGSVPGYWDFIFTV